MKIGAYSFIALLVPMALGAMTFTGLGADTPTIAQAAEPMKIEVVITNKEFKVSGHTLPGELTEITVKNQDTMTHGFTSPLLNDVGVKMEGDGVAIKGKGVNAYHVDPGKVMKIRFTKHSKSEPETMRYVFWCDLHPEMKGELFIVETKGEIGGG
jgi:uncharacterized membrane protein